MLPTPLRAHARALIVFAVLVVSACTVPQELPPGGAASPELQALERRVTQLQDINDLKRLQRAYGYYVDQKLWDEVTNLFANDGSIEIGLDGVYRGKARVREYLYALGNGKSGLAPGELNEHMQLMPVITLSPDGRKAKGTWRAVILAGQKGKNALWGEGPYENEYVKDGGIWRLSKLHWFQTTLVPFEGGWAKHEDVNGGRFVTTLKPDAPSSVQYKTWPAAYVPPFHFKGREAESIGAIGAGPATAQAVDPRESPVRRLARLTQEIDRLQDQEDIEKLQRIYGFYIDKGLWSEAAALFADDGEVEVAGRGAWVGKTRVLDYLRAIGPEGLQSGRLHDNMQLQPVVHVAADGRTAKGRWHLFAQLAEHGKFHEWGTGIYENDYVKDGKVWKIRRLHLYPTMYTPFDDGWAKTWNMQSSFEPQIAPDRKSAAAKPPFHYANPVTGARARAVQSAASPSTAGTVAELEHRVSRLEDVAHIENLQMIYGYYLATLEWDALATLFADDGTIEIAQRGIYVGRAAVRRNLDLYGQQGLDNGVLHNHMQYQPVIDIAPDGRTAKLRSRALSMMGNFGRGGQWMGGIYENEFVKVDGVWRFIKDQQINTYFAPYDVGWKDLPQRPAPGITQSNPPDRPPSFPFEMYPKNFLPPFHYVNPVTGKP